MIIHIFKKDVRLLWKFALLVALANWFNWALERLPSHFSNIPTIGKLLGAGLLVAAVVHQDSVPDIRQDWIIRPIRFRDLVVAKLLFVIMLVQLPAIAGDIVGLQVDGFPLGQSVRAALLRAILLLFIYDLPVMAIASVSRNWKETIIGGLAIAMAVSFGTQSLYSTTEFHWRTLSFTHPGMDWIPEVTMFAMSGVAGLAILWVQYLRRRTTQARWLVVLSGVLCLATYLIPWQPVFAIQRSLSAHPGAASGLQLEFKPDLDASKYSPTRTGDVSWIRNKRFVRLPVLATGLAPNDLLRTDLVEASLIVAGVQRHDLGYAKADLQSPENTNDTILFVPDALYSRLHDQPVQIELHYALTLLRLEAERTMPALNGKARIPEFGSCRTNYYASSSIVDFECQQAAMTPPCMSALIADPRNGPYNKLTMCAGSYSPISLMAEPDPLRRLRIAVSYTGTDIANAQLVSRWYDAVEHFERRVTIPDVRLSKWKAN